MARLITLPKKCFSPYKVTIKFFIPLSRKVVNCVDQIPSTEANIVQDDPGLLWKQKVH
jgi:hypothetical protein